MQLPSAQNQLLILEWLLLNFQYTWGPKTRKKMSVSLGGGLFLAVVCGRTAGGRWRVTDRFIVELQELGLVGLPSASLTAPLTRPVTLRQWTSPGFAIFQQSVRVLGAWCHCRRPSTSDSLTHGRVDRLSRHIRTPTFYISQSRERIMSPEEKDKENVYQKEKKG